MMHMSLYWGKEVTLLFDSWRTESWPSYALALLLCFLFSAIYQLLEAIRIGLRSSAPNPSPLTENTLLTARKLGRNRWVARFGSAGLFGVSSAMGYLIMLAVMSYNGGVLVAVVLGMMVGYYLFRSGDFGSGDDEESAAVEPTSACACS